MKKTLLCSLLFLLALSTCQASEAPKTSGLNFSTGLAFNLGVIPVQDSEAALSNEIVLMSPALLVELEIFDYISLGVMLGYNLSYHREPLDFQELPLSLRLDQEKFSGPLFGVYAKADPLHFGDFMVKLRAAFTLGLHGGRDWLLELPVVEGTALGRSRLVEMSAEALLGYQGIPNLRLFIGPSLNLLRSTLKLEQEIAELEGLQEIRLRQKRAVGALLGASLDISSHWEASLKAFLLNRTALVLEFLYVF